MVLDLVLIGLAIAVNPFSVTAFVLVLSARGGIWNGLAFVLTWLASFVAIIAVVLLMTGGKPPPPKSAPSTATWPSNWPSAWASSGTGSAPAAGGAGGASRPG